ncbi:MAG: hypothetical protein AB7F50_10885 [Fimbriimonadaceae bacterium]
MRRTLFIALAASFAATTWAQAAFTIRRPLDGSIVRESVGFRVPKNSIPDSSYLGVKINDKFVEAVTPTLDGNDYVYWLDSQAHKLADGPMAVELSLYQDVNGSPRLVGRTSVNLTLDNSTSIKVPENGYRLRYRYNAGTEHVYKYTISQDVQTVSQAQARLGGRGVTTSAEEEAVRVLHAVDNAYSVSGQRQGLLRMQILPDKGKSYATIIPPGSTSSKQIGPEEMDPIYMRLDDVGREVFTALPLYFGLEGNNGAPPQTAYFPIVPMYVLPTGAVKPGQIWQSSQMMSSLEGDDLVEMLEKEKHMRALPARGQFEGVTWYKNYPCAKLTSTVALGKDVLQNIRDLNQVEGEAQRVELKETLWLALDRGLIVRREISIIQEALIDQAPAQSQGGGGSGGPTAAGTSGGPSAAGTATGGGGSAGSANSITDVPPPFSPGDFEFRPGFNSDGQFSFFQQTRGGRGQGRGGRSGGGMMGPGGGDELTPNPGGQAGGAGQGGGFGQRTAGGSGTKVVVRVSMRVNVELEK